MTATNLDPAHTFDPSTHQDRVNAQLRAEEAVQQKILGFLSGKRVTERQRKGVSVYMGLCLAAKERLK